MKTLTYALAALLLGLVSCTNSSPDISNSKVDVSVTRFDQEFGNISIENPSEFKNIREEHTDFFDLYAMRIMRLGNPNRPQFSESVKSFLSDFSINYIHEEVNKQYPELNNIEKALDEGFSHFHYYFPEKTIPAVYTFISGMNQSMVVADSILGIGIDKYMGRDWEGYNRFGISKYLRLNMNDYNIPVDALRAWGTTEFEINDSINNVLSHMVYQGSIQYYLEKMFPEMHDSLLFGFTKAQLQWCENNEEQMWTYLLEHKLLFSTEPLDIKKLTDFAPYTSMFTQESPGKAVVYLGREIVKKYMDKHPELSLEDLLTTKDYYHLLSESKYNP